MVRDHRFACQVYCESMTDSYFCRGNGSALVYFWV